MKFLSADATGFYLNNLQDMQLIVSIHRDDQPAEEQLPQVARDVARTLPAGIKIKTLANLALVLIDCPDTIDLDEVRKRVSSCKSVKSVVDDARIKLIH